MQIRIFILVFLVLSWFLPSSLFAEAGYIGEDLWNNIYRRLDEGVYKLKKQLIETRLKDSTLILNGLVGMVCSSKTEKIFCFRDEPDFTASELEDIAAGSFGPIYAHIHPENNWMNTEMLIRIRGIVMQYYKTLVENVTYDQQKLQSIGSIGLFTDGNKDNSSHDLMNDLEDIHAVIFAKDIPYNGTENKGASSIASLLAGAYSSPFSQLDSTNLLGPTLEKDPGVSVISPSISSETVLASLLNGSGCAPIDPLPNNLDPNFLRDVQTQLLVWTHPNSSIAFSDDGKLPESWAKAAMQNKSGGSPGSAGGGSDKFPCSGKDFFCIMISMVNYTQNLLAGGKAATIEKILDENLKIVNKFASASQSASKMPLMFFGIDLNGLNLPGMLHIWVEFSLRPPPILNLKPSKKEEGKKPTSQDSSGAWDEFNTILIGTMEDYGLDFKRQNSFERSEEVLMIHNLEYQTTDALGEKSILKDAPRKSQYTGLKAMELKKSYGDSFNLDLFELHGFTVALTKNIQKLNDTIKWLNKTPKQ